MKQFHEVFHFRDNDCNVVGAYVFDTVEKVGIPVRMEEFRRLVAASKVMFLEMEGDQMICRHTEEEREAVPKIAYPESLEAYWANDGYVEESTFDLFLAGALPAIISPVVKIPLVGKVINVVVHASSSQFNKIRSMMPRSGPLAREVTILGVPGLTIQLPLKVLDVYKSELVQGLKDCIFCWPPTADDVTNTENARKASVFNRVLGVKVENSLPQEVSEFFASLNNQKIDSNKQIATTKGMSLF